MSTESSIRVPEFSTVQAGREVDCETLVRDGVTYYRQRVIIEAMPDMANESAADTVGMLGKILKELRLMNLHLASMTGERFTMNDLGE